MMTHSSNLSLLTTDSDIIGPDENELATLNSLRTFNFCILILIIFVGLSGNLFAAVIICISSRLKRVSSNHYLVALALSDNIFLLGLLMIWLCKLGLPTYHDSQVACKFVLFLLNSSGCLSGWYVTVLTMERFIVVYYPLYRQRICSVGRTRRAIIILLPWPLLFNIWIVFAAGVDDQYGQCDILPAYYRLSVIMNAIDTTISFVLPVLVIVSLNTAICIRLWTRDQKTFSARPGSQRLTRLASKCKSKRLRTVRSDPGLDNVHLTALKGRNTGGETVHGDEEMRKHTGSNAKIQKQEHKITKTLLIISFVYVALNMPSYSVRLRDSLQAASGASPSMVTLLEKIMRNVFLLIYYINFAINFIVYCLSSKNFRDAITRICARHQSSPPTTSTATTGSYPSRGASVRNRLIPSRSPSPCPTVSARSSPGTGDRRWDITANTLHPSSSSTTRTQSESRLVCEERNEDNPRAAGDHAPESKNAKPSATTLFVV